VTSLAPLLETFFTERLLRQRQVSPHTIAAYRDAFRLLLGFAEKRLAKAPSDLLLTDIDATFVGAFLDHLEKDRSNSARSRNARLAAIRSFFRFSATREPAHGALIQRVLAIPQKRFDRNLVLSSTTPRSTPCWPPQTATLVLAAAITRSWPWPARLASAFPS
jgi:integrase/recombinase XerD